MNSDEDPRQAEIDAQEAMQWNLRADVENLFNSFGSPDWELEILETGIDLGEPYIELRIKRTGEPT
jgi:hypothetical protein